MRTPWKIALVSALVLTVLFGLSSPASAYHTVVVTNETGTVADNTVVIPMNHSRGYTFVLAAGGSIQYGIQSRSGNFDLFFFDSAGLVAYRADPPQSTQAVDSYLNKSQFGGVFNAISGGSYTVMIDNVDFSGAVPTGTITVQVALVRSGGTPSTDLFSGIIAAGILLCVGVIAVIVIVIFLIVWLITRSNRPAMPPPMPPYMPPQQPWPPPQPPQQPPQGGAPPGQWPPQNP